jgi:hypothetical protein
MVSQYIIPAGKVNLALNAIIAHDERLKKIYHQNEKICEN